MKSKLPTAKGRVIEALPNTQFIVEFDHSQGKLLPDDLPETMRCYVGGRMRKNRRQVKVRGFVEIEFPDGRGKRSGGSFIADGGSSQSAQVECQAANRRRKTLMEMQHVEI
jgi:hypothetical protein